MGVPTISMYATPPSSVCSAPHPCQINGSYDFDLGSKSSPSVPSTASSSQKQIVGGLSCMFSSQPVRRMTSSSFCSGAGEESVSLRHDRGDELKELSSSFCYSPSNLGFSFSKRDQSPVSVFQGPVSCGTSCSRSPPLRPGRGSLGDMGFQSSMRGGSHGLFGRVVRNALGSCIDYDPPSSEALDDSLQLGPSLIATDDFTFDMEDLNSDPSAKDLLIGAQLRHNIFYDDFVIKAFNEAEKAHRGQMRASGDPYLQHCVETAVMLAMIGANSTVVAAGLLHDTLDDSFMNHDYIISTFGAGVADLVGGVSKLSQLSKLARENDTANKTVEADRMHTMFLAMADARAVLIKLADRLHNMMTLDALPLTKQKRFAKETLEIFAPIANRLGIFSWKEQLENLCFKHLYPDQYEELSSKLVESSDEAMTTSAISTLEEALNDKSIAYHVISGRHKSLYSIHSKMLKKKLSMDKIHDIHGLRLIVENKEDCYKALQVVHQLWSEVPGKFKDYINHPKFNGYQSLHTVVMGEGMVPLEVQIRTKEMHLQAEFGFAAHWRYKEGDSQHSSFVLQMVEWARWVVTWQCQATIKDHSPIGFVDSMKPPCKFPSHSEDCPYSYKAHCGEDGPVFIIMIENDKMSVQELPANSSIMNLLERGHGIPRWTPYRYPLKEELRPRLNHEPVSDPTYKLKMGDVVELMPTIPDKSLTEYREEMQRMYDRGIPLRSRRPGAGSRSMVGWRS